MEDFYRYLATIFSLVIVNNETCVLYNEDYYSKFHVVKTVESMSAEDLIWATKVVFNEFGLPKNLCKMWVQILFQNSLRDFAGT